MKRYVKSSNEYQFPDTIYIKLDPISQPSTWCKYDKMYERGDGGCYYKTTGDDGPFSIVSLYPDGSLTIDWNGRVYEWDAEWRR